MPPMALLGSGEFEAWTEPVDRWLLERARPDRDGSVLVLPTASAPEGDGVFERWAEMGLAHFRGLGVPALAVPLKTREDAARPALAALLERASVAYFSGGNPAYLAATLAGSAFWSALLAQLDRGLAYAGCSAGVASLGEAAPDSSVRDLGAVMGKPGLGLFPGLHLAPHWDALDRFVPGLRALIVESVPDNRRLLAIDERTALVGDGRTWTVLGSGGVELRAGGEVSRWEPGDHVEMAILPEERMVAEDARGGG